MLTMAQRIVMVLILALIRVEAGKHNDETCESSKDEHCVVPSRRCDKATYKQSTLINFVYKDQCFPKGWKSFLNRKKVKDEITKISEKLAKEARKGHVIEPPLPSVFKAFVVGLEQIKVIILGKDPTPQANKATGMAFSLKPDQDPSDVPSVFNVLVELKLEGFNVGLTNGDLTPWTKQGVLLLNSALTIRRGDIGSHQKIWKFFTRLLIEYISEEAKSSVWILWGNEAKENANLIDREKHYIKAGGHPNARSSFFGRNYFQCANDYLEKKNRGVIDWSLPVGVPWTAGSCDKHGL